MPISVCYITGYQPKQTSKTSQKVHKMKQVDVLPSKNQALCCELNPLIYCHLMSCNDVMPHSLLKLKYLILYIIVMYSWLKGFSSLQKEQQIQHYLAFLRQ